MVVGLNLVHAERNTRIMGNRMATRRFFGACVLGLVALAFAAPGSALADCPAGSGITIPVLDEAEIKCQRTILTATVDFIEKTNGARQNCFFDEINRKFLRKEVDCRASLADGGTNDDTTDTNLRRAEADLTRLILKSCTGIALENLGYPGFCEDSTGGEFEAFDAVDCILDRSREINDFNLSFEHPPFPGLLLFPEIQCQDDLARRSSKMFSKEIFERGNCLVKQIERKEDESTECRAEEDPIAPFTGNNGIDNNIVSAHNKVLRGIANFCNTIDLSVLGFPHQCPFLDDGSIYPLPELVECMYESHHLNLFRFLDVLFPCSTLCGNTFLDQFEECDDGDIVSENGDFCRNDCTAVACGDPNDDGVINATDSLYILRTAVGLESCSFQVCDVTGDFRLNATDALQHLQFVVGLDVELNCPIISPTCGNGFLEELEECDDGDDDYQFGEFCNSACFLVECGDTDDGGFVNILDAQYVLNAAVDNVPCDNAVCDITGNRAINSTDALRALMHAVGLNIAFNCPDPPPTPLPPER